jgi:hypothetical protein
VQSVVREMKKAREPTEALHWVPLTGWMWPVIPLIIYGTHTIVTVTKLHASRPRKYFTPPPPYRAARSQHYRVASFATLRVLSCLHSPRFRCSCCNVVRFFCDLEACSLVTVTLVVTPCNCNMPCGICVVTSY